jgi:hypothetical protein
LINVFTDDDVDEISDSDEQSEFEDEDQMEERPRKRRCDHNNLNNTNNSEEEDNDPIQKYTSSKQKRHKTLKNMNVTRWNSLLNMLKSFIDLKGMWFLCVYLYRY